MTNAEIEQRYYIYDANGQRVRPKTKAEREEDERQEELAKARVRHHAAAIAQPDTRSAAEKYLEFAQSQLDSAHPATKTFARARLAAAKKFHQQHEEQAELERRKAEHAANPSVRLARENASCNLSLSYPNASPDDIALAQAIAFSDDLPAEEIATRYWEIIGSLSDNEAEVAKRKAADAKLAAIKANVAASAASEAAKEAELKAVQVQR